MPAYCMLTLGLNLHDINTGRLGPHYIKTLKACMPLNLYLSRERQHQRKLFRIQKVTASFVAVVFLNSLCWQKKNWGNT